MQAGTSAIQHACMGGIGGAVRASPFDELLSTCCVMQDEVYECREVLRAAALRQALLPRAGGVDRLRSSRRDGVGGEGRRILINLRYLNCLGYTFDLFFIS